ncbi:hypothetical protein CDL12_14168 [Handroanthus impetiginosus]|uniref:Protein POLYCHOME n=1 Tax=Handroanthus impetiginosus TaxID=429701 RepID=A0A2G9H6V0_9LAMI|nr:hypothetical protein CDL12_14168 [Handroanthus impetiginosus]
MPEARDRLSSQEDALTTYSNQRRIFISSSRNFVGFNLIIFVLEGEDDEGQSTRTPLGWIGTPGSMGGVSGRGSIGTSRIDGSSAPIIGQENISPIVALARGRGQGGGNNIFPAWFRRKPLRDITDVMKAIERRRTHLEERQGLQTEGHILQDQTVHDPFVSVSDAQRHPTTGIRQSPPTVGKVPKILVNITDQNEEDSACLTPQKKLLNNIDTVEKVVMEELRMLKRTPSAKKAERGKRVRTLMSMR